MDQIILVAVIVLGWGYLGSSFRLGCNHLGDSLKAGMRLFGWQLLGLYEAIWVALLMLG